MSDVAVSGAADDHLIFADIPQYVIVDVGDLILVRDDCPCLSEKVFEFQLVELGIVEDPEGHFPVVGVDQLRQWGSICENHPGPCVFHLVDCHVASP